MAAGEASEDSLEEAPSIIASRLIVLMIFSWKKTDIFRLFSEKITHIFLHNQKKHLWKKMVMPSCHFFCVGFFQGVSVSWLDGQAAYLLISALPSCLDPDAFAIPPPSRWSPTVTAEAVEGGHGVPLGLVARHPEVAWEVDGQLQLLIGAAKRTGDPKDVW